jgi:hypothetical protein
MLNISFVESGFFMAICLVAVTFLMPLFSRELRKSVSILFGYWFVLFLHQVVAFLNAHLLATGQLGTPGAAADANAGFHNLSKALTFHGELELRGQNLSVPLTLNSFMKGGAFYYEMLGSVYKWFGVSHLLGEQLSILAFALSCIVLLKIIRQLGLERYHFLALICFGALPSMVLLGSVTLREPYELFFFMLTVYLGLKVWMKMKLNIGSAFLMVMSAFLIGVFHKALLLYAVFLVLLFLIWSHRPISRFGNMKKIHLIGMVITPIILYGFFINFKSSYGTRFLLDDNFSFLLTVDKIVNDWRNIQMGWPGRTTYDTPPLDFSSPVMFLFTGSKIYSYYFFAGFSWGISNFVDVAASMETILRTTLLCFSVLGWWKAVGLQKRLMGLMLVLYFSMTLLWAMGTTNYGTAIRHHMLTWWIIVILGVPPLMGILKSVLLCMVPKYVDSSVAQLKS